MGHKKPTCPYCKADKDHPDGVAMEWKYKTELNRGAKAWWQCPECGSRSPAIKADDQGNMFVRSHDAAMERFRPMQKPLALDEAVELGGGLIEIRKSFGVIMFFGSVHDLHDYGIIVRIGGSEADQRIINGKSYGKNWRVWRTRPTDEERAAAAWEEKDYGT